MKLLYSKPKADKYRFYIYHLHYKKKSEMIEFVYKLFLFRLLPSYYHYLPPLYMTAIVGEILQQVFFLLIMIMLILLNQGWVADLIEDLLFSKLLIDL